ncbi:MAG TPA: twin-arginine translocase TatA/TatE family subunit [Gemmatimonadaceae bacterium]|nr:twin-arginine translocase TatA/TatE family subunit [Gemmatimonadaceae bacterium]
MNFGNVGFMEILLILVVVLLLFGAKRIPEIAGSFGKGIREFKKSMTDVDREVRDAIRETPSDRLPAAAETAREPMRDGDVTHPEPKRLI